MASYDTMETFRITGLVDALEDYDVTLYDLNAQPHVEVDIPGGKSLKVYAWQSRSSTMIASSPCPS